MSSDKKKLWVLFQELDQKIKHVIPAAWVTNFNAKQFKGKKFMSKIIVDGKFEIKYGVIHKLSGM